MPNYDKPGAETCLFAGSALPPYAGLGDRFGAGFFTGRLMHLNPQRAHGQPPYEDVGNDESL